MKEGKTIKLKVREGNTSGGREGNSFKEGKEYKYVGVKRKFCKILASSNMLQYIFALGSLKIAQVLIYGR